MTFCAARTDEPGFFTPCNGNTQDGCTCGKAVKAEVEAGTDYQGEMEA